MKATEQLKNEHSAIKLMISILEAICQKQEEEGVLNLEHLEGIVEFIKVFSDKCHHGKEEGLFFPAIEEAGIPKEGGPVGVMLMEHDLGRNCVKDLSKSLGEYKAGGKGAVAKIIENARNYSGLLLQHIEKEDNILYPIADNCISEEKQNKLLQDFEKVEREVVGEGRHEEFHKFLEDLGKIYL